MEVLGRLKHHKLILWPFSSYHYRGSLPSENQSKCLTSCWAAVLINSKHGASWIRDFRIRGFPVSTVLLLHPCWLPNHRNRANKATSRQLPHLERCPKLPPLHSAAPVGKGCIGGKAPTQSTLLFPIYGQVGRVEEKNSISAVSYF